MKVDNTDAPLGNIPSPQRGIWTARDITVNLPCFVYLLIRPPALRVHINTIFYHVDIANDSEMLVQLVLSHYQAYSILCGGAVVLSAPQNKSLQWHHIENVSLHVHCVHFRLIEI